MVDSEGFSIPPPDRTAWPLDNVTAKSDSLLEMDDFGSENGRYIITYNIIIQV